MVGLNCAVLSSKLHSFDKMLIDIQPGIFFLKKTKQSELLQLKQKTSWG